MDRRRNFRDTLNFIKPAQLVLDFGGNPLSAMDGDSELKLLHYLGFPTEGYDSSRLRFGTIRRMDERIQDHFDTDTRSVGTILFPEDSHYNVISDDLYTDEWGITRRFVGTYWEIVQSPLKGATVDDLEKYRFPDPDSVNMEAISGYAAKAKQLWEDTDKIICAEHPVYGIFELGCWMCGFEDFLAKMVLLPEFVHLFFERMLEYQKRVIEHYYGGLGDYVHYTSSGDDFATQTGPFFSPDMFKTFITPYFSERIRFTKQFTDAAFLHHSCGSVFSLIDDIMDCGVDILNPIQPKARDMSPENLKRQYGGKIVFHGGVDTQELLPYGSDEQIEQHVHDSIRVLNADGGYIFAAAHNIQPDVQPGKIEVMLRAAAKYRTL